MQRNVIIPLSPFCISTSICTTKIYVNEKSAQRDANTAGALAVVRRSQKFSPRRRPLPGGGGVGRPKFNQLVLEIIIIIIIISLFSGANSTSKAPRPTYSSSGTSSTVSQKRPQSLRQHCYGQHRANCSRHAVQQQQRNGRRKTCSF